MVWLSRRHPSDDQELLLFDVARCFKDTFCYKCLRQTIMKADNILGRTRLLSFVYLSHVSVWCQDLIVLPCGCEVPAFLPLLRPRVTLLEAEF